jgi:hypothetical protein
MSAKEKLIVMKSENTEEKLKRNISEIWLALSQLATEVSSYVQLAY